MDQENSLNYFEIKLKVRHNGMLLFYTNGDADTQTPLHEAQSHFEGQKRTEKGFIKVCGGGHGLIVKNLTPEEGRIHRLLDGAEVYSAVFAGDIESFESIDGYCNDDYARLSR